MWRTVYASAMAGVIGRTPVHPLDTCKARLQVQTSASGATAYRGMLHAARQILATEGWRGLYRGYTMAAAGSIPGTAMYLGGYEVLKHRLAAVFGKDSFLTHFTAGFGAETVSCLVWVPVDVVKERLQVQRPGDAMAYRGSLDAISTLWRSEGIRGVYKGYGATLLSFGPYSAFYFLFYEQLKEAAIPICAVQTANDLPSWATLSSASFAGALAALVSNPLDIVKIRLQVQRGAASTGSQGSLGFHYAGVADGVRTILQTEGPKAFLKGAGARMMFMAPSTAITISAYEELMKNSRS